MDYQQIIPDTRNFKTMEFSAVPVGAVFYSRRPTVGSDVGKLVKTESTKNEHGTWANAKYPHKISPHMFIRYDAKVVVVV